MLLVGAQCPEHRPSSLDPSSLGPRWVLPVSSRLVVLIQEVDRRQVVQQMLEVLLLMVDVC